MFNWLLGENRKIKITFLYAILVGLNKKLGLEIPEDVLMYLAGVIGTFLISQGWVDSKDAGNHHDNHRKENKP